MNGKKNGKVWLAALGMLGAAALVDAQPALAAAQRVVNVQTHPDGTVYITFLNGTGCTGNGYIINAGSGAGLEHVVSVATASLLSGRPVAVELVSTTPAAGGTRCTLSSIQLQ